MVIDGADTQRRHTHDTCVDQDADLTSSLLSIKIQLNASSKHLKQISLPYRELLKRQLSL
jgi:hypothetical protein